MKNNRYGFNFSNHKDFEIYSVRQRIATSVFADFVKLGYDRDLCLEYLLRFVSGWLSVHQCVTLIKYRDHLLRDCGTPFPEMDCDEVVNLFTNDCFEISIDESRYHNLQVLPDEQSLPFPDD